jgi:flagellar protein FliS
MLTRMYTSSNANETYLEARVMSASPLELVRILYDAAQRAVQEARRSLAAGDIPARSRHISSAGSILVELAASLDERRGGEIAARLKALYDYMGMRLLDANLRQADEPLAEVLALLATLAEAWTGLADPETAAAGCAAFLTPAASGPASHTWSA